MTKLYDAQNAVSDIVRAFMLYIAYARFLYLCLNLALVFGGGCWVHERTFSGEIAFEMTLIGNNCYSYMANVSACSIGLQNSLRKDFSNADFWNEVLSWQDVGSCNGFFAYVYTEKK